ncbi:MAG: 16S rRNA (guanine(966)-N(2))-methyltransferase RsmD [Pseudomonadales bacterium]
MATNEVRIIGGNWRGRKLRFPDAPGLRPTLGRSRETLFNWLVSDIADSDCLDLFAGSGALGFEALSRGAKQVTFVEQNRAVAAALRRNAAELGISLDQRFARVLCMTAEQFLRGRGRGSAPQSAKAPFDIVFLDPPFGFEGFDSLLETLRNIGLLTPHSLIYVETPRRQTLKHLGFERLRETHAGDTHSLLLTLDRAPDADSDTAKTLD